ncbi:hypothetical protein BS50DRAFT_518657 [Corynespora cassiicola Philippines]|uniref:Zn(2)-C6 fungal-type domain-containing protein n=1 Tax=Corynespora cassiicola Philippines TaxID=1448308 RepID=A0A2T2P1H5_CORCC|nr:hypothetical protein BS50DRAFT_518657 [Corynespora cassiicola Philippines]
MAAYSLPSQSEMDNDLDAGPDSADGSSRGGMQRACDSCRSRKIRCDRTQPCSNCKASKLVCTTTQPTQKPSAKRVHISDEYERKIDRIEDRLAGIENVLELLAAKLGNLDLQKDVEQQSSQRSSKVGRSPHASTPAPFEGETTMTVQSEFARELLKQAVDSTPSIEHNAEVKAALTSLQDMVSRAQNTGAPRLEQPFFKESFAELDPSKLERPPWEAVIEVLDKAAKYPSMCFAIFLPFVRFVDIDAVLKEAYTSPVDCPVSRRVLIFGVLYNLFQEFTSDHFVHGQGNEGYRIYAAQSKRQLELAMSQLDLYIQPTFENIVALVLAGAYAVEMSKPSLCWVMISHAAGLCQNLGYHRYSTMKDDAEEERASKLNLFWFIYMLDKTLSLRLGRASTIQDWDISLPYLVGEYINPPKDSSVEPAGGSEMMIYWIKVAQIQGQAYEKLFSPAGSLKSPQERTKIAQDLVCTLDRAWAERGDGFNMDFSMGSKAIKEKLRKLHGTLPSNGGDKTFKRKRYSPYPSPGGEASRASNQGPAPLSPDLPNSTNPSNAFEKAMELFYLSDVVMHYSTCALIQRAQTSAHGTFTDDCLESSREALRAHEKCNKQFNVKGNEDMWSGYVHWSILQAPFTPFIVIFCKSISSCDLNELATLSDFVTSLESARTVSEGADKLYKMCHLFLQVARLYIEAKRKEHPGQSNTTLQSPLPTSSPGFFPANANENFDLSTMAQFDPYLSALGLAPTPVIDSWPAGPTARFVPVQSSLNPSVSPYTQAQTLDGNSNPVGSPSNGLGSVQGQTAPGLASGQNPMQDWFSGSRYIMGLMEQDDINMPDFSF